MTTETTARTGVYEGMFLVSQAAAAQFGDTLDHIHELFGRANATVLAMKKWDDRRLAYEVDKQKRGVYILSYFSCPTDMVTKLERDVQISSKILRLLVVKADHLTDEEIAVHDDRRALADEAKMRAERAEASEEEGSGRVRLGAPEPAAQSTEPPAAEREGAQTGGPVTEAPESGQQ